LPSPQAAQDPVATLLREVDPIARSRAHTALAHRAIDKDDLDTAEVHLREATDLDPTDEVPRELLASMQRRRPRPAKRWFSFLGF
jgi:DNA-binding SARP family transcriptional activator